MEGDTHDFLKSLNIAAVPYREKVCRSLRTFGRMQ